MKIFKNIRELFWPLLDDEVISPPKDITTDEVVVDKANLEFALNSVIKRYEAEEDRKKTVEAKSSLFIGTISVVTTVVVAVTSFFIKETTIDFTLCLLVFLLLLLIVYMARTVWYSIKALERKSYYSLSAKDFLFQGNKEEYQRKIIVAIINKTQKNYATINGKVDSMVMAQEYFKRAIIVVVLYAVILVLFIATKSNFGGFWQGILFRCNNIHLSTINLLLLYVIGITALFFAIRANVKQKKRSK